MRLCALRWRDASCEFVLRVLFLLTTRNGHAERSTSPQHAARISQDVYPPTLLINASICPRYRSSAFFPAGVSRYSVRGTRPSKNLRQAT